MVLEKHDYHSRSSVMTNLLLRLKLLFKHWPTIQLCVLITWILIFYPLNHADTTREKGRERWLKHNTDHPQNVNAPQWLISSPSKTLFETQVVRQISVHLSDCQKAAHNEATVMFLRWLCWTRSTNCLRAAGKANLSLYSRPGSEPRSMLKSIFAPQQTVTRSSQLPRSKLRWSIIAWFVNYSDGDFPRHLSNQGWHLVYEVTRWIEWHAARFDKLNAPLIILLRVLFLSPLL